ncbi:MAG: acyltransferase domain-containing protein, partial [Anaerolineales bacterium]|nr:acyltransferase domain-containing protein [Anaerolineales bacterium]
MSSFAERFAHLPPLQRAYLALEQAQSRVEALEQAAREPIAIVGLGCRFPGGDGPDEFWRVLRDGLDMVTPVPPDRWDSAAVEQTLHGLNPAAQTVQAAFLKPVDQFDAAFFGISPREAAGMDPQQRLLLEVVWEALDNAGLVADQLAGSHTGVFVGVHSQSSDYYWMQAAGAAHVDAFTATGTAHSVVAGRISYLLDWHGPSVALDTACSSSLVAVDLACQSLRGGECDLAFAGGVNLRLSPEFLFATVQMGTASPTGRCRAFDAAADGIVFGEGCGLVVLKRLRDAVRAGDAIWALVLGSAVNHDGRSAGLAAPNGLAQQAVIRQALQKAGVSPSELGFVEAHGTGTPLGDPIEIEALAEVLGAGRAPGVVCAVGSVKTNIGHLEGAAGIAGLIKAVLALHHGAIPPSLHLNQLNPHLALHGAPLVFPTTLQPWPAGPQPRYAGVSSFGWSGTNAHIVLSESPAPPARVEPRPERDPVSILPLSARSPAALSPLAAAHRSRLASGAAVADLCYSAGARRTHHDHRVAFVGGSPDALIAQLDQYLAAGEPRPESGVPRGHRPKLAFVFPGQGGQWAGMGRGLLAREPAFRAALAACD